MAKKDPSTIGMCFILISLVKLEEEKYKSENVHSSTTDKPAGTKVTPTDFPLHGVIIGKCLRLPLMCDVSVCTVHTYVR